MNKFWGIPVLSVSLAVGFSLMAPPSPAWALTHVDELQDVKQADWAYEALRDLVERYNVIEAYPNLTFRGNMPPSRWQMAAALDAVIQCIGQDLARLGAEKAGRSDLATLGRLTEELRTELTALQDRTQALEARATAIDSKNEEQDSRLSLLEKTTIHGDMVIGGLADMANNGIGEGPDGIVDAMSAMGRVRLTLDIPVIEDREESKVGAGTVSMRLIGAYGRYARLASHPGNTSGADYPFNLYSRVTADVPGSNEGIGSGATTLGLNTGGQSRLNVFVESAFYKQHFKPGIPLLTDWTLGMGKRSENPDWQTTGDLYTGYVRWWDLFDVSAYRGNEMSQFQNNAFINIPGIAVNIVQPTLAYQWHQGLGPNASLDVSTALGSMDNADLLDTLNLTYEGRLNYNTTLFGFKADKPGSLYAGAYHIFNTGARNLKSLAVLTNRSGGTYTPYLDSASGNSFYAGWNQEWFKGIGTNVGYLVNNASGNNIVYTTLQPGPGTVLAGARQSFTSVINIPMTVFSDTWRPNDAIGLGYAWADLHEGGLSGSEFDDGLEHVMEAYYRWQVNDTISIMPSVQLIANRLGLKANDMTTVLGLRMNYLF